MRIVSSILDLALSPGGASTLIEPPIASGLGARDAAARGVDAALPAIAAHAVETTEAPTNGRPDDVAEPASETASPPGPVARAESDPAASNDTATVSEDGPAVVIDVLGNDAGVNLTIGRINGVAVSVGDVATLASGATVTVNADGTLGYDPNGAFESLGAGETGTDSFTYVAVQPGQPGVGASGVVALSALDGTNGFRLNGIDGSDYSGISVSGAGDVNGDGIDDVVIGARGGAPGGRSAAGESYVVFGASTGFAASLNLSALNGTNGFRLDGIDDFDQSGASVSGAGDVNGDGVDDLIIGARYADPGGRSFAGESYVVFGSSSGFAASLNLSALNGANGFRLDGFLSGDLSGASVSGAGDVNGDGIDDLIIGTPYADPGGRYDVGQSYVVFGSTAGFAASLDLSALNGANGFRLAGIGGNSQSGFSVSDAGDVNGDGLADMLIGANRADPGGRLDAGENYVVFGASTGFAASLDLSALNGTNGFRLDGIDASDQSGFSVSGAGDVNGDGIDDLIIGADGASESYVLFGASTGFAASQNLSALNGSNGFRLDGAGVSVSGAGDVNGDGMDDLIIGADTAAAGVSYVVFGASTGFGASLSLSALNGANGFRLDGIDVGDGSGRSVSGAGDVNGDGVADLIIGAPNASAGAIGNDAGESYVVFGGADIAARFSNAATVTVTIQGEADLPTEGDDTLFGTAGADTIDALGGNDSVSGRGGNDSLVGGAGVDTLNGGDGDDTLVGELDGDRLEGGAGRDTADLSRIATGMTVDLRFSFAFGVSGFDLLIGIENVLGGQGADTLLGDAGANVLSGGDGADLIGGGNGNDTLIGGAGADFLYGAAGIDEASYADQAGGVIVSLLTNSSDDGDILNGVENLRGGVGGDALTGSAGANTLIGEAGDDTLAGEAGNDLLGGGDGNDVLQGGAGADQLFGAAGVDEASYADFAAGVTASLLTNTSSDGDTFTGIENLRGGSGADSLTGSIGNNAIIGGGGADSLIGDGGNDTLVGEAGNDLLGGGDGADQLFGEAGADQLFGAAGNDSLTGGDGNDTLSGGAGRDAFRFTTALGGAGTDRITDFAPIDDILVLENAVFTGLPAGALAASAFHIGAAAADAADRIVYDATTGALFFDADGSGAGAAIQFATLNAGLGLTAADVFVI